MIENIIIIILFITLFLPFLTRVLAFIAGYHFSRGMRAGTKQFWEELDEDADSSNSTR